MKNLIQVTSLLVAVGAFLLAGCVVYEHPGRGGYTVVEPAPAAVSGEAVVEEPSAPPPVQVEVIPPQPDMTFIWVSGCWEWEGHWVWVAGRWAPPPRRGAVWVGGHWEPHGQGHVWVRGHWR